MISSPAPGKRAAPWSPAVPGSLCLRPKTPITRAGWACAIKALPPAPNTAIRNSQFPKKWRNATPEFPLSFPLFAIRWRTVTLLLTVRCIARRKLTASARMSVLYTCLTSTRMRRLYCAITLIIARLARIPNTTGFAT